MFKWALVFLVLSVITGVFGFTGIAVGAAAIAKVLFFVGLFLFVLFLVLGVTLFKSITWRTRLGRCDFQHWLARRIRSQSCRSGKHPAFTYAGLF